MDGRRNTTAYSKKSDEWQINFYSPKEIKLKIKFEIDGKSYTRESVGKPIDGKKGYARLYQKYADKKINILYSPRYDKVLILKD